ncbi:MAG: single-stranded DNA-binding protein [Rhodomicrobium sp.]
MKGIEAAFFGGLGREVDLRTSKSGKPWASLSIMVETGEEDADGHAKAQWIKVAVFGENAERLAGTQKGTRLYTEGTLKLDEWKDKDGFDKHGLSVAAWKCEKVGSSAIGRNRPKVEKKYEQAEPTSYVPGISGQVTASSFAGPAQREKPKIVGRDDFGISDEIPF